MAWALAAIALACAGSCRPSSREIAQKITDATLLVESIDFEGNPLSQGTAFYVSRDTVLTNMHVLKWAKAVRLSSPSKGLSYDVRGVVGISFDHDLCMLQLVSKEGRPLPFAKKGSVAAGDRVFVSGNPQGMVGTVSTGIVSSIRNEGKMIQFDAPISPGSSGGPVVNETGQTIGIATRTHPGGQNLNFAVELLGGPPVRAVEWSVQDLGKVAPTDLERRHLKGRVREVTFRWPPRPFTGCRDWEESEQLDFETVKFNTAGMATGRTTTDGTEEYSYHDARIFSRITIKKPGAAERQLTFNYEKGRKLRADFLRAGVLLHLGGFNNIEDRYNAFGQVTEEYDGCIRTYDSEHRLVRLVAMSTQGSWRSTYTYEYDLDSRGNWVVKRDQLGHTIETREIKYYSDPD